MEDTVWYIIKVVPGKERKLCDEFNRIVNDGKLSGVLRFFSPSETESVSVKEKTVRREKTIYAGYLFFESVRNVCSDVLKTISELEGVTSMMGSKFPTRMRDKDVIRVLMDEKTTTHDNGDKNAYVIGDRITIINGPFKTFTGKVINLAEDTVDIEIKIFDRNNNITLNYKEIEKLTI